MREVVNEGGEDDEIVDSDGEVISLWSGLVSIVPSGRM